jgi:hypothetical protein
MMNFIFADHLPGPVQQNLQQTQLTPRQLQRLALQAGAACGTVENQRAESDDGTGGTAVTA